MRCPPFEYLRPASLAEACALVADGGTPLAGGHSLLPEMKRRRLAPDRLIDLRGLAELSGISQEDDGALRIGALTTHAEVVSSEGVRRHAPWLADAARHIADVQVRNVGTIGGNVCFADCRGNYHPALLASDARLHLYGLDGAEAMDVADVYAGFRATHLAGRLLVAITLPATTPGAEGRYVEMTRQPNDVPLFNLSVVVAGDPVQHARVAVGGLAATPLRLSSVEAVLEGRRRDAEVIADAVGALEDEPLAPLPDLHAPPDYRVRMAGVLLRRTLTDLFDVTPEAFAHAA